MAGIVVAMASNIVNNPMGLIAATTSQTAHVPAYHRRDPDRRRSRS
jgi:hypothetical protein